MLLNVRSGFLALAQFPPTFLFATKNSVVSTLLGPGHGYEKLNYIHRWSARGLFLGAVVHGALWIRNHLEWDLPIIGQQKETSGVAALGVLCVIVITSWRGIRRMRWELFWAVHILAFPAFFITVCYHTIYAAPWIFPPLAFYGLDILLRMFKYRIKDASLVAIDQQMTLVGSRQTNSSLVSHFFFQIHIPHCTSGWLAGQHIRLRVFFEGRVFESHPLTIMSAPSSVSCLSSEDSGECIGVLLGARVRGDWTRALNAYTQTEQARQQTLPGEKTPQVPRGVIDLTDVRKRNGVPVQVLMDGPYGGCSVDLGSYETVLLFAGGSGATFTIGLLDEIVGRCVKKGRSQGEKTRRIEFSWCIRSFGMTFSVPDQVLQAHFFQGTIGWFAAYLMQIAQTAAQSDTLDLHISIYVTCLCNPEAVPPIPNSDVTITRPSIHKVLESLLTPPVTTPKGSTSEAGASGKSDAVSIQTSEVDLEAEAARNISNRLSWVGLGGGVAVCSAGPETMTREASNAVARIEMANVMNGGQLGSIGLHTELFSV